MRIVILSETFAKNMGYAQNCLPKALARLGLDVHLVTTTLPPYYYMSGFKQIYGDFIDHATETMTEEWSGYTIHYLPFKKRLGRVRMQGLFETLQKIKPDIVQASNAMSWLPLDAALAKRRLNYKLFTANHTHASVLPLAQKPVSLRDPQYIKCLLTRTLPGRFVSLATEKCYAIADDCADVAVRFYGVQEHKVDVCPLGVDTDIFFPVKDERSKVAREQLRAELGFAASDIVSIYTGRFTEAKNPLVLAKAVEQLASAGAPFRALFVGNGPQSEALEAHQSCVVSPFLPFQELGDFYRAAEIGVWPTQESMSMLDASACGLPIIINDTVQTQERIEISGAIYRLNDVDDMVRALKSLQERSIREKVGQAGAQKMATEFSWLSIAERRVRDYKSALAS